MVQLFLNAFGHGILYFRALVLAGTLVSISGLIRDPFAKCGSNSQSCSSSRAEGRR